MRLRYKKCRFCGESQSVESTELIDKVDMIQRKVIATEEVFSKRCTGCGNLQHGYTRKIK